MMLIFRRKLRTIFKKLVMILMISGVVVTRKKILSYGKCAVKDSEEFQDNGL